MVSVIAFFSTLILGILPFRLSDFFYTCKWILSYISIKIYKKLKKDRLDFFGAEVKAEPENLGFLSHPIEVQLESPYPESHLAKANDGIFFYGVNSNGDFLVLSIARLPNQKAEATVHLRLASGKKYELLKKCDYQQSSANTNAFTCGGLQVYCLCPMKRWRIFYSGYLKETSDDISGVHRMKYVKFSFRWRASSDVYDNTSDLNERNVAESIAKEDWKSIMPPTDKLSSIVDFYAQTGTIMGTVSIEDTSESWELYLFGERMRFLGNVQLSKEIEFSHTLGYVHKNGMYFHFGQSSATNVMRNVNYGFVIKPSGNLRKVEKLDVSVKTESVAENIQEIKGSIKADRSYTLCGSASHLVSWTGNKEKSVSMSQIKFLFDGKRATGMHIKVKYNMSSTRKVSNIVSPQIPDCVHPLVVAFTQDLCLVSEITGGKGSSLGKLTSQSRELQTFTVPCGVAVTTSSYKRFINTKLLNEIKCLEDALYATTDVDPKEASKRVCEKIIAENIPKPVTDSIVKQLVKVFGDEYNAMRFAVRSSATGEDTEQMSAAGQMDTFLGITGLNNILSAVKKCWASQFGFTALQYKRRYGQSLNSPMAVVIQEMVSCDVAGVIFTCDPVSGNASKMSIAANFGLGESVVSASIEPDTIELARDENDELRIHSITAGTKNQKIILTDEGTTFEDNPEEERRECCLSAEDIFRLGHLAIKIEKCYRSKRDIEWGIKNGSLFLFQSRPVTSGTQETDFEIEHELDGSLRVENDYYSVSNTAEVLPGALTHLSQDVFLKLFRATWKIENCTAMQSGVKGRYFANTWFTMYNHIMFNIPDIFHTSNPKKPSSFERATMVGFFGRILDNEEILEIGYDRFCEEEKPSSKSFIGMIKNMLFAGKYLKQAQKHYANYRIPTENYSTSKEKFKVLMQHSSTNSKALATHLTCTQGSSMWNMVILTILAQDKEIDVNVYTDFSKIITVKGDVESAGVPSDIENLVLDITKSIKPEDFKAMTTEEALRWLKESPSRAGKKFKEFITKHGHRCVREFDFYTPTWGSDPKPLVQLLQRLAGSIISETTGQKNENILNQILNLKTSVGLLSKLMLLVAVPFCRRGVQQREASKSLLIRCVDVWRKATWDLANCMVSEGRLPDAKLLFFMTLEEIKELLESRSPKILAKIYQRQKLYPKMDEYRFPEIMRGIPKPLNENDDETLNGSANGDISMKGIPVSQGVAKGYVRVAVTLDEAAELKPGEILLTYGTDIGWTPYFPTLAGVATELGGLISHGAVVSREYGLPCIAGLHGATKRFKTGDYVVLDGNKGVLQKTVPP